MEKKKERRIIASVVAISLMQGLQYGVSPVLDRIAAYYPEQKTGTVQMLISAPALLSMFVALLGGYLATRISKKRLLVFAGAFSFLVGIVPLFADSFPLLFVCRALYGISLGLATALNTAVVAEFFTGPKRVMVMGVQGASVGIGMTVITTFAGILGSGQFQRSYLINVIGLVSFLVIALCLPETGPVKGGAKNAVRINRKVIVLSLFGFLEFFFLITYTANIAMHLTGALAGSTHISGILTGVFSGVQILAGFVIGAVTKKTGKYLLPLSMLSFAAGAGILAAVSSSVPLLLAAAVLCGMSQGFFMPSAMVGVSNAVSPDGAAMAAACLTTTTCLGQLLSSILMNGIGKALFGAATTSNVFLIAAVGMLLSSAGLLLWKNHEAKENAK